MPSREDITKTDTYLLQVYSNGHKFCLNCQRIVIKNYRVTVYRAGDDRKFALEANPEFQ